MATESSTTPGNYSDPSQLAIIDQLRPQAQLQLSHRLTPGVTLHVFSLPAFCHPLMPPSGHIELQFGPELDLISGGRSLTETDRRILFTPCRVTENTDSQELRISILAGNGRVTQLISAPRLDGALKGALVGFGGGFPPEAVKGAQRTICIASGTGIAPFLSLLKGTRPVHNMHLFYGLRGSDFQLFEYLLNQAILDLSVWESVDVYVTAGDDGGSLVGGKTEMWWQKKFADLATGAEPKLGLHLGRMSSHTFEEVTALGSKQVFFCGSKSLEWQVKMWFMNSLEVYTTW